MSNGASYPGDAGNWLLWLLRARVDAEYDQCRQRITQLREQYADITNDDLANLLVKDASVWAAMVGAGLGAIDTIPGVGQAIAAGTVLPEI
ncbi:MAG: hypothetical protein ACR2PL_09030, partial [Dehalococcoidia bacterium]